MRYDFIKSQINKYIATNRFLRKLFYLFLDLLILRQWYVKKYIHKYFSDKSTFYDAGAGFCQYSDFVLSHYKYSNVFATDLKDDFLQSYQKSLGKIPFPSGQGWTRSGRGRGKNHKQQHKQARFKYQSLDLATKENILSDPVDFIICIDTLEHIDDDTQVIQNFYNILKPNGYLLLSTPSNFDESAKFAAEHVRDGYALSDLIAKVQNTGLVVVETEYSYGFWGQIYWNLVMKVSITLLNISKWFILILPIYLLIVLPLSIICMLIDFYSKNKQGNGILLIAQKP